MYLCVNIRSVDADCLCNLIAKTKVPKLHELSKSHSGRLPFSNHVGLVASFLHLLWQ